MNQLDVKRVILRRWRTRNVVAELDPAALSEKETELSRLYRELEREKMWSRIHLVPLLMAEGDRDMYRRQQSEYEKEKEIMKDIPGWKVSRVDLF